MFVFTCSSDVRISNKGTVSEREMKGNMFTKVLRQEEVVVCVCSVTRPFRRKNATVRVVINHSNFTVHKNLPNLKERGRERCWGVWQGNIVLQSV